MSQSSDSSSNKFIGIDYGSRRVGVAISDEEGRIAFPLVVLENSGQLVQDICKIVLEKKVRAIVLGDSKNYAGKDNLVSPDIAALRKNLEGQGLVVYMEPEFMTSVQAERWQGKNGLSDASAAAIILQSFLEKIKNSA